jgi:nucleoside-diphosphate-sugar epimerase
MACLRVIASCFLDYEFVRNGDGNIRRDFTFIDDAAQSICALLDLAELPEGVINIGGGHDRSLNEMVEIAQNFFGNSIKLSQAAASNFDLAKTKANPSRLHFLIGEAPSTTLEEGILKTINWVMKSEIKPKLLSWINSV